MKDPALLTPEEKIKCDQIEKLLVNTILPEELKALREKITAEDLSNIIQKIYDLNENHIFQISAVDAMLEKLNLKKNQARNARFNKKINKGFRQSPSTTKQIVLVEGDSWFNYPVILTDVIDRICMEKDLAVYSVASGGDWLLNMLSGRQYVEELSVIHPDWFLISGGGNDLVGSRRLAAILQPEGGSIEFQKNKWTQDLIDKANMSHVPFNKDDFHDGLDFLSKEFYALLMFFHLQYYFLLKGVLSGGADKPKFPGIRIITQGYDYPIPSFNKKYGWKPGKWYIPFVRNFLGHGKWLKSPMQLRGINDSECQRKIMYSMIWLFNEMMIEMGTILHSDLEMKDRVFHIDSRNSVGKNGWTDELHPQPKHFMKTGEAFISCINQSPKPTYNNVYVVSKL
jgi:hypothetical protein